MIKNYPEFLENLLIVSPDAGGVTRAKSFLRKIEKLTKNKCELAFMIKERPRSGEVGEARFVGPSPEGKNILIVDDIIDSGGTLCVTAKELKKMGAKTLACYATHGIFTKGTEELSQAFDKILTSNTHYQENGNVEVIDMTSLFAEAIFRAQKGHSISELFD